MRQLITHPGQVGEIIRGRRKAHRISQQFLAERLKVSQSRLSVLEARPGEMTLERLIALAQLLDFEIVLCDKPHADTTQADW